MSNNNQSSDEELKETIESLLAELSTQTTISKRQGAIWSLGKLGKRAIGYGVVEPLIEILLNDEEYVLRCYAAQTIGKLGDLGGRTAAREAISALLQALQDDAPLVRNEATAALTKIASALGFQNRDELITAYEE
ncbi:MAG: hypothetical protein GF308_08485 [Candidatus Heimdallarchaeota archaeon]|nr:hypothetical protein [Candidatus Heimdallarchaeota archaeon]